MLDGGRNGGRVPFRGLNAPPQCKSTNIDWNKKISTYNKCKSFLVFAKSFMQCDTQTHKNQRVAAPPLANYIVDNLAF